MKYLLCMILTMSLMGCSESAKSEDIAANAAVPQWVLGKWRYDNQEGESVVVTIYPDGSVLGNILSKDDAIGSWYFIDGVLYIIWTNGWTDLIEERNGYIKLGFAPGVATSDSPTNRSKAEKLP